MPIRTWLVTTAPDVGLTSAVGSEPTPKLQARAKYCGGSGLEQMSGGLFAEALLLPAGSSHAGSLRVARSGCIPSAPDDADERNLSTRGEVKVNQSRNRPGTCSSPEPGPAPRGPGASRDFCISRNTRRLVQRAAGHADFSSRRNSAVGTRRHTWSMERISPERGLARRRQQGQSAGVQNRGAA
jgi:hypothetical protein